MPEKMWAVTTILFFHNLLTVIRIGGMITLGLVATATLGSA